MSDEREEIFSRVRQALEGIPDDSLRHAPRYRTEDLVAKARLPSGEPWADFQTNLEAAGGRAFAQVDALVRFLKEAGHSEGYCDPALFDEVARPLEEAGIIVHHLFDRDPDRVEDYAFGITVGTGAVAETGTLVFDDESTSDRLAALAPWVHVVVLRRNQILRTLPDAIAALGPSSNVVWATGPSKTADVEGILIEGVHGPGEQIALILP